MRYKGFFDDLLIYAQDHPRLIKATLSIPDHCAVFPAFAKHTCILASRFFLFGNGGAGQTTKEAL